MRAALFLIALQFSTSAVTEVVSAGPNGFEISHSVSLVAPQATAYSAFGRIGGWWAKGHTYSGDSANLRLSLTPGGCFCERFPDGGGIEHLRVTYVDPGKRVVMTGALGPLLYEAAAGVLDVRFERIAGGTRVNFNYRAAGFAKGGAEKLAPLVDQVIGEQVRKYRIFAAASSRSK